MKQIKLIIAGGRNFQDYDFLKQQAQQFIVELKKEFGKVAIEIVSGGAKGVDALGERFALECGYPVRIFKADWTQFGRAAGPKRNADMALYGSHLLSFWDGKSTGTKSMINQAKKHSVLTKVISIDQNVLSK